MLIIILLTNSMSKCKIILNINIIISSNSSNSSNCSNNNQIILNNRINIIIRKIII